MARTGGSRAVETFLRNFEGERQRYQEILEVALCYGVFCLAQNFSLKSITLEELRTVTRYDDVRKRDLFVNKSETRVSRRVAPPAVPTSASTGTGGAAQRRLRAKPPHAWRDGAAKTVDDEFASHLPADIDAHGSGEAAPHMLPTSIASLLEPQRDAPTAIDDVDFHSRLLGKPFVDTAWAAFTGRNGSQITTHDELDELYVRVDQRKKPPRFPRIELPITSFAEFLNAYVTTCVSQFQHKSSLVLDEESVEDQIVEQSESGRPSRKQSMQSGATAEPTVIGGHPRRRVADTASPAEVAAQRIANTKPAKTPARGSSRSLPKSLQHVRSKIQPELSARRDKVLRVKKTQTQLMKESLARARLAEYEAQRHLDEARDRSMFKKKASLSDIPKGAAALEIVDNFVRSPLMDTFGKNGMISSVNVTQAIGKKNDPVQDELYGAAPVDDSFVGCKVPPRREKADRTKRGYNGWLGDFGPSHTKTVRHEWGGSDGDIDDDDDHQSASKFEWNFDNFTEESHKRQSRSPATNRADERDSGVLGRNTKPNAGVEEDASSLNDSFSDSSNSVYQWLKETV